MGLFSNKEEVPEVVPAPTIPTIPAIPTQTQTEPTSRDLPELPSFPANSKNENFNQEMVKSAVSDMPSPGENEVHVKIPEGLHVTEEPEEGSMIPPRPSNEGPIPALPRTPSIEDSQKRTLEIGAPTTSNQKPKTKEAEPIFVRIDKFQSAQKNFNQIKDRVKEIESVLKKIKDVKSQEEVELKGWTEDVEKIKARLSEVDSEVFNQI